MLCAHSCYSFAFSSTLPLQQFVSRVVQSDSSAPTISFESLQCNHSTYIPLPSTSSSIHHIYPAECVCFPSTYFLVLLFWPLLFPKWVLIISILLLNESTVPLSPDCSACIPVLLDSPSVPTLVDSSYLPCLVHPYCLPSLITTASTPLPPTSLHSLASILLALLSASSLVVVAIPVSLI